MNVVDSSAWLEVFTDGPNTKHFLATLEDTASLLVPAISVYEVFKVVLRERGETEAMQAVATMRRSTVVELDGRLALSAARLSLKHGLPMADSIVLATATHHGATVWTQDADFEGLPGVKYFPKQKR